MSGDTGVWTYAITEHRHLSGPDGEVDLSRLSGVGAAKVRAVTCEALTVLVSDVSLAEFGETALSRNLEDLDWLDKVAREHHYVIGAAARMFPLLPARLATVYTGDAALCAVLASRRDHLRVALRRVGGRVEWGVKAYPAPEADRADHAPVSGNRAGAGPDADATGGAEPGGGGGRAYLKRRRAQLTHDRELEGAAMRAARAIHADLTAMATAARLHPPQSAQLSGVRQPMLLNAAYLIDAADAPAFTAAVPGLATAYPELRVELTGPWPPYSFVGDDDDGQ